MPHRPTRLLPRRPPRLLTAFSALLHRLAPWAAAAFAVALYWPTLGYDLVYDSQPQIAIDSYLHEPAHMRDVLTLRSMRMDVLDFNRPVQLLSLMLDSLAWDRSGAHAPHGYRLTGLLLHGAVAGLLVAWLRRLLREGRRRRAEPAGGVGKNGNAAADNTADWPATLAALLAGLLFAAHPLHTETVIEVGYREDLLCAFFLLLALWLAAGIQRGGGVEKEASSCKHHLTARLKTVAKTGTTWLAIPVCLLLAVGSKETGALGPALLALYAALFRWRGASWRTRLAWAGAVDAAAVLVVGFLVLRFAWEPKHSLIFTQPPGRIATTPIDWFLTQSRIWAAELLRVVWPDGLCARYGPESIRGISQDWAALAVLALGVAQAVASCASRRLLLASALFWGALLPVSNLVPIYCAMADRFLYVPLLGAALGVALALYHVLEWATGGAEETGGAREGGDDDTEIVSDVSSELRATSRRVAAKALALATISAALAAVALLTAATLRREPVWRDALALWSDAARATPSSGEVWRALGFAWLERGHPERSPGFLARARELHRDGDAMDFAGEALVFDALGRREEALRAIALAARLDNRYQEPERLRPALLYTHEQVERLADLARQARGERPPQTARPPQK